MKNYNIDLEAWFEIEANNEDDAMRQAQEVISKLEDLANNYFPFTFPLEVVVRENGIEEA